MTDPFSRHELLDRTHLVRESIEDWLYSHPAIRPDEQQLLDEAQDTLGRLYQLIGTRGDETPEERAAWVKQMVRPKEET